MYLGSQKSAAAVPR